MKQSNLFCTSFVFTLLLIINKLHYHNSASLYINTIQVMCISIITFTTKAPFGIIVL